MGILLEIFKMVLPAIIAGIFTFFITKYSYNKNRPLDKLEIAYNRIYYPIFNMVSNKNLSIDDIVIKSEDYIIKYDKYVDVTTKQLLFSIKKCKRQINKKMLYKNFKNNIYYKNYYLRKNLGYLGSGVINLYNYSTPYTKSLYRLIIEFCIMYLSFIVFYIAIEIENNLLYDTSTYIFMISCFVVAFEIIWLFIKFIYYKIIE